MKTAISIPDNLFRAAEDLAKRLGVSRSVLYQRAVEQFLKAQGHDGIRESLDEIYKEEAASTLDPAIQYMQNASIAKDDW